MIKAQAQMIKAQVQMIKAQAQMIGAHTKKQKEPDRKNDTGSTSKIGGIE